MNVQKNVGKNISVKNAHVSQSKTKAGSGRVNMPAKELPQRTVRNLVRTQARLILSSRINL